MLCMVPVLRVVTPQCFEEVGHLVPALVSHILRESETFGVSIGRDVYVSRIVKCDNQYRSEAMNELNLGPL